MIFQGLSVARNCHAPVAILDIKRGLCVMNEFWKKWVNFGQKLH